MVFPSGVSGRDAVRQDVSPVALIGVIRNSSTFSEIPIKSLTNLKKYVIILCIAQNYENYKEI